MKKKIQKIFIFLTFSVQNEPGGFIFIKIEFFLSESLKKIKIFKKNNFHPRPSPFGIIVIWGR